KKRLEQAIALRKSLFSTPFYRLCHAEGDLLPGVVIDRYDSHLTIQISTQATEQRKDSLLSCLDQLLHPTSILFANDIPIRSLEQLSLTQECLKDVPEEIALQENGLTFTVPLLDGQKTGWFYDQRRNRMLASRLAKGRSMLDAFCYAGGFGVHCAAYAKQITFLDSSKRALLYAERNFATNRKSREVQATFLLGDAFTELHRIYQSGKRFGLISIDPPALIKRRKDTPQGIAAYRKLNHLAIRLLEPDGILVSSSCSFHLEPETLTSAILRAAQKQKCVVQILAMGSQDIDHPKLLGMPETSYLKCCFARMLSKES
ncbi:MAG: class I SAM-dependent rRNA methyltransferase, partial [Desulfovibrio sp.]|nr:class I SAM-dependent rRNA methyltransferase [Desulfovibrio sp.]